MMIQKRHSGSFSSFLSQQLSNVTTTYYRHTQKICAFKVGVSGTRFFIHKLLHSKMLELKF